MMMNIFNIFDPSTSMKFSLNWLSMLIFLLLFPFQYWLIYSRLIYFWIYILNLLFKEFKILMKFYYSNLLMFLSLFMLILFNNIMGLFPYIFTASSHMSFSFSLSLNLWISIMLFSWINFMKLMLSHLVPSFTPFILMPFMVIIELISLFIRPFTLSIRLSANMIAGHLLLSLLGSSGLLINNLIMFFIMMFMQIMLFILEISVSLIQTYVFTILSLLYSNEI